MAQGIEIVCTLKGCSLNAKQTALITEALVKAVREAVPDTKIRACWVHEHIERKG